jgi:hypothetical protein
MNRPTDVCEDCGAVVPEGKAGCQRVFDEVIAREFSDYIYSQCRRCRRADILILVAHPVCSGFTGVL